EQAIENGRAVLPCDINPPISNDEAILVLFYHGSIGTPIYSIDARGGSIHRAVHWVDNSTLQNRAYFDMAAQPNGLVIKPVLASDHAHYRCRVDFRASPSRNTRVQLLVIVPPKHLMILDSNESEVSGLIGPYPLGSSVTFTCQVNSG
ncbi:unnamed protein product, partial [Meganyctiphanes norvegica]